MDARCGTVTHRATTISYIIKLVCTVFILFIFAILYVIIKQKRISMLYTKHSKYNFEFVIAPSLFNHYSQKISARYKRNLVIFIKSYYI